MVRICPSGPVTLHFFFLWCLSRCTFKSTIVAVIPLHDYEQSAVCCFSELQVCTKFSVCHGAHRWIAFVYISNNLSTTKRLWLPDYRLNRICIVSRGSFGSKIIIANSSSARVITSRVMHTANCSGPATSAPQKGDHLQRII